MGNEASFQRRNYERQLQIATEREGETQAENFVRQIVERGQSAEEGINTHSEYAELSADDLKEFGFDESYFVALNEDQSNPEPEGQFIQFSKDGSIMHIDTDGNAHPFRVDPEVEYTLNADNEYETEISQPLDFRNSSLSPETTR